MKNDLIGTYLKDVSEYPLLNDEQQRKLLQKTKKIGSYAFFKKRENNRLEFYVLIKE